MSRRRAVRQRGVALLALLAVIMLGASWFLVSRLNLDSNLLAASNRNRNAEVLNRAKQALIGYIAAQAAKAGEDRPGAFPCPEAPGNFDDAANEGSVSYPCTPPIVGRFPWRTLGLDKLVDVSGEPLWYAVASGWAGANTVINSNCASYDAASTQACRSGRLSVDGVTGDVVAILIAPGPAIRVSTSANCTAWTQARPTVAPPDWRNYLECQNATNPADMTFATTGPSGSFNDQVMTIAAAEIVPAIEAAIANRIEREIVPAMKSVYASSTWHGSLSAANPLMPHPAPFGNPSTSRYQGAAAQSAGLLPLFQTQGCTPATDPRCTTATTGPSAFLVFSKSGNDTFETQLPPLPLGWIRTQSTCAWSGNVYTCSGEYELTSIRITLTLRVTNIAMGLRTFDASRISCTAVDDVGAGIPEQNIGCLSTGVALQADGSALVTVTTNWTPDIVASGWGTYADYKISFDRAVFGDHALVNTTDATTGWFARNRWHEVMYYAAAAGRRASALPALSCTTGTTCLSIANVTPAGAQRSILILGGRSINGSARPSTATYPTPALSDYFEHGNAVGSFERRPVTNAFGTTYADTGTANTYAIAAASVPTGATLRFKAANANTGASTLNSPGTGTVALVASDGSALAAGAIPANGVIEVVFDGAQFLTAKRPFNDRVVVVDSN